MVSLEEIGGLVVFFVLVRLAIWVYFDGLERLNDLEAGLWAVALLLSGALAFLFPTSVVVALVVLGLYVVRSRGTTDEWRALGG